MSSGVSACGFVVAEVFEGMRKWPRGSPPFSAQVPVRACGLAGSRTGRSPAGVAGAGGVLDAGVREPMIEACGKGCPAAGLSCMRLSSPHGRLSGRAGRWLHSFLLCPMHAAGHGVGSRQEQAPVNHRGVAPPRRAARWRLILQHRDPASLIPARQPITVGRDTPTRSAIAVLDNPSAANNTIRARCANPAFNDGARVHDTSSSRSASDKATSTVNGIHHDPTR